MLKGKEKYVLIIGGAGFIGSHLAVECLRNGHDIIVLDNLQNSAKQALHRVETIAKKSIIFIQGDVGDANLLHHVFLTYPISMVIHLAALKAVGESVTMPLAYYHNNVSNTLKLLQVMQQANVKTILFSSSATVYGKPEAIPLTEGSAIGKPQNPYAASKVMIEQILQDLYRADPAWSIAILRYFNPTGAHESSLIGEASDGIPNNLVPFIAQVAIGQREKLLIYGNDYRTSDGTGVRDYIHVVDLALGHLKAADYLLQNKKGIYTWNLGRGCGHTVLEVVDAFEQSSGKKIPYEFGPRRAGDVAEYWADCSKANSELNWYAQRDLSQMMVDVWRWQKNNPNGFATR